jgi:CCR4-NOT transcription complex subunit 4
MSRMVIVCIAEFTCLLTAIPGTLPRGAAWAQKIHVQQSTTSSSAIATTRQTRRGGVVRQARTATGGAANTASAPARASMQERRMVSGTMPSSQASSSRPVTPAPSGATQRPNSPTDVKALQKRERTQVQLPPSPCSIPPDIEGVSVSQVQGTVPPDMQHEFTDAAQSPVLSTLATPSVFFAAPPGLSAPPGIRPARPPRVQTASPQTPLLASQSSYQMSTAARALLDDVKARRESAFSATTGVSPFPDFDRTLQTLSREDGGGFSFNLDPALAGEDMDQLLPDFEVEANTPFHGSYVDAFPALRPFGPSPTAFMPPPGLPFPQPSNRSIYDPLTIRPISALQEQPSGGSPSYMGSFDPFAEASEVTRSEASSAHQQSPLDDDPSRKVSRFGFARGRQAPTSTPSPFPVSSQLSNTNASSVGHSFGSSVDGISGAFPPTSWPTRDRHEHGFRPSSMQHPLSESVYPQHQTISQALDTGVSEAQLRDLIQSSREKANTSAVQQNCLTGMPFEYCWSSGTNDDYA